MRIINKVALQNISHQNFRSLIFFFLVFIASACIFGTGIFTENMKSGVSQTGNHIGADIIVVPSNFSDDAKEILFAGNACTILFKDNPADALKKVKGIKQVSEQLYLETLKMECCAAAGVQIIAIDIHSDFAVGEWLKGEGIQSLGDDEIIVGCSCGLQKNDKINFYDRQFTVVAVLDETGMGYDESAFVSYEAVNQITSDSKYESMFRGQTGLSSMILINVGENFSTEDVIQDIFNDCYQYGISAYSTEQLTEKLLKQFHYYKYLGNIMNFFVILLATVSLFSLITITFHQRRNRVGSLLSVGIKKKKILQVFLTEYIYLVLAGVTAGIVLVCIFAFPLHSVIKHILDLPYKFVSIDKMIWLGFKTVVINVVILLLAVSLSFVKIIKSEPAVLAEEQI